MAAAAPELSNSLPPRRWRFGRVRFDEVGFELHVGGQPIEVERKPLEVLRVLLQHHGKVVTKSQLVQLAWPGRVIGDAALAKAIARLREAIGDVDHDVVRTHHRYGYRLVADVAVEDAGASVPMAAPTVPAPASPAPPRSDAEHRVLTMMFCDIVDSTHLAESLDPEAFRDLLLEYQRSTAEIAQRYEGHVAQQFGDGMLFYFGYPDAHDDDAERAVRCACELLGFASRAGAFTRTSIRIGIHTGPVVVGEGLATGSHLHLASRLQGIAEPDTILISDETFRLVPGLFVTRDFGTQILRGVTEPMRVHQVLQPSGARSRLDTQPKLTPFVAREAEIAQVDAAWSAASEGTGRALLFLGEPGMGKSRLLLELRTRLSASAHTWLEGRADALHRSRPFHVAAQILRRSLGMAEGGDDAQRLRLLERRIDERGLDSALALPLLASVLDLPIADRHSASSYGPEQLRERTAELLSDWVGGLAEDQPLALVVEDLHWCDPTTLEFLGALIRRLADLPLLLVMTARPEFVPPWPAADAWRPIVLLGLDRSSAQRMLAHLGDGTALAPELSNRVVERAAGVPLFVEELARSLRESTRAGVAQDAIPRSLDSVLRARLDRLGSARELLQAAAVVGMECGHGLLQQVSGLDDATFTSRLAELTASGMVHLQVAMQDRQYVFKHALIRDAAYAALLKSNRQALHARAAQGIEHLFADRIEPHAAVLGYHWEAAGHPMKAAGWIARAATHFGSSDATQALHLWRSIPSLLRPVPDSGEKTDLLAAAYSQTLALLWRCSATDGDITAVFEEGREALSRGGGPGASARLISSYAVIRGIGGAAADYVPLSREAARLASQTGDADLQRLTRALCACAHWWTGDFTQAVRSTREVHAIEERSRTPLMWGGMDMRIGVMFNIGFALGYAGGVEEAMAHLALTSRVAEEADDLVTLCHAQAAQAWFGEFHGDRIRADACARRSLDLAQTAGASFDRVIALIAMAVSHLLNDRPADALERLDEALNVVRATRAGLSLEALILSLLADVHLARAETTQALDRADEAIAKSAANGSRGLDARAHLARARALRAIGTPSSHEAIAQALDSAAAAIDASGATSYWPAVRQMREALFDRAPTLRSVRSR